MTDPVELRTRIARALEKRATAIADDAVAVSAFAGMDDLDASDRTRLLEAIVRVLSHAVRETTRDSRSTDIIDLRQLVQNSALGIRTIFSVVHLLERSALGELAVDDSFGTTSETWPAVSQAVRRASFDVCATLCELRDQQRSETTDAMTGLHTREVLLIALDKEIQRAERFSHSFALIVIDIDRLSEINAAHGQGAGDFVIERVGIVVRNYFRETDWVARTAGGAFGVLLPETSRADAQQLANRVRIVVEERLHLSDYRSDDQFPVTVSIGVLVVDTPERDAQAPDLLSQAEEAVGRAKQAGRNRVESVDAAPGKAGAERID
ncbi:MAG: GGDEF domain-containing protein [Acidobacteria bacterium]|nr:GGDEF domain-containing protein [Acidobacteriota bacterium]